MQIKLVVVVVCIGKCWVLSYRFFGMQDTGELCYKNSHHQAEASLWTGFAARENEKKLVAAREEAEWGLGRGKTAKPVDKDYKPPFQGTRCALDSSASCDWSEDWLLTGAIVISILRNPLANVSYLHIAIDSRMWRLTRRTIFSKEHWVIRLGISFASLSLKSN